VPLTLYTTIYTTIYSVATYYLVSRYRIVSDIVTRLDVDYYDERTGELVTRISYPTRYLRGVYTRLVSVETRTAAPQQEGQQRRAPVAVATPAGTKTPIAVPI
jgi:hypothetical protein